MAIVVIIAMMMVMIMVRRSKKSSRRRLQQPEAVEVAVAAGVAVAWRQDKRCHRSR